MKAAPQLEVLQHRDWKNRDIHDIRRICSGAFPKFNQIRSDPQLIYFPHFMEIHR